MVKKPKVYTKGVEGIERVLDTIADNEKAERRAQWIKEHTDSNTGKIVPNKPNTGG